MRFHGLLLVDYELSIYSFLAVANEALVKPNIRHFTNKNYPENLYSGSTIIKLIIKLYLHD